MKSPAITRPRPKSLPTNPILLLFQILIIICNVYYFIVSISLSNLFPLWRPYMLISLWIPNRHRASISSSLSSSWERQSKHNPLNIFYTIVFHITSRYELFQHFSLANGRFRSILAQTNAHSFKRRCRTCKQSSSEFEWATKKKERNRT
jgi:hypothetical protein